MKSFLVVLSGLLWAFASIAVAAQNLDLNCSYIVEGKGKWKNIAPVVVEQILHIRTDNGDYLEKMSITIDSASERTVEYKHPSEYEKEYDSVEVEVSDNQIRVRRLNTIDRRPEFLAAADLRISRQTGKVVGDWRLGWYSEGTVNDIHALQGRCVKYEQAF